jgi:hypothetical protein
MGFHYLIFVGGNLENKILMPVQIMNSASLNRENIVSCVNIFNDIALIICN